jgi:glycosyltransferase involved in cell wall biosynthesis
MFTPSADGGMAQYARELLTALAEQPSRACRCELVSGEDLQEVFRSDRYPIYAILPPLRHRSTFSTRLGWVASRLTHYPRRDWRFLRWLESRPDITGVHFQELTPWLAPPLFKRIRRMGKSIFYTVHNVIPHRYPALVPERLMNRWIRRTCRLCDGLFVHGERLAAELSEFLGDPHPPIRVVPHGVWSVGDVARTAPLPERLGWKRLLFFGAIRRNKGLHLLLDAMEHLPGFGLTIAGEPHERDYYQSEILPRIRRLQDTGARIDLRGRWTPEDEIEQLFTTHGAVVMPYTSGFVAQSGVLFMALAYETPVIAGCAGALGEFMKIHGVGSTIDRETPRAVADAVLELHGTADTEGLSRRIAASRRRYSWREAAAQTLAGYQTAHQTRSEPGDCPIQTISAV